MKREWNPIEFECIRYDFGHATSPDPEKLSFSYIIRGIDDVVALLDDHLVKVQTMRASPSLASMAKLRIQFARNNNGAVVSRIGRKSHSVDSVPPKKLASSSSPSKSIISMHQITQNASPCLSFQSLDHEITMTFRTNPIRTGACPTPGALVMAQCVRGPQRTHSRFIHSFSLTF